MRCNNCGWDNAPNTTNCIKCGHSLQIVENNYVNSSYSSTMGSRGNEQPKPTVVNAGMKAEPRPTVVIGSSQQNFVPRPTRVINNIAGHDGQVNNSANQERNCPNCGYPVAGGFTSCPNCGTQMGVNSSQPVNNPSIQPMAETMKLAPGLENVKCQKCGTKVSVGFSFCPNCGVKIHLPTIRAIRTQPLIVEPPKPRCCLTTILEEGEVTQERKNSYEGDRVMLNRDNTEPTNRTITSQEQAELIHKDGKWYIIDKSELCSTFIEAKREFEILSGDIIVLGDRKFKFEVE